MKKKKSLKCEEFVHLKSQAAAQNDAKPTSESLSKLTKNILLSGQITAAYLCRY
jgi:hypothetical protein